MPPIESLVLVIVVALVLFALIERDTRRVVRERGQGFSGVRAAGRDTLPSTAACVGETCAPLATGTQRLRIGMAVVDVIPPPPSARRTPRCSTASA